MALRFAISTTVALRNVFRDFNTRIDSNPWQLRIYAGEPPENMTTTPAGDLLAQLAITDAMWTGVSAACVDLDEPLVLTALTDGTPGLWRMGSVLFGTFLPQFEGLVGPINSDAELIVDDTNWLEGHSFEIHKFMICIPNQ